MRDGDPTAATKGNDNVSSATRKLGRHVGRDVGSTALGNVIGAAAALAAGAVLAHWLGPTGRGIFEIGLFAANTGVLILSLGLNIPVSVFLSRQRARGIWAYRLGLFWLLITICLGLGLTTLTDSSWRHRSFTELSLGVIAAFGALYWGQLCTALLVGSGRLIRMNVAVVTRWVFYLLILAIVSAVAVPDPELALCCFAAAVIVGAVLARTAVKGPIGTAIDLLPGDRLETLWFGLRGQVGNILQFASYRFDVLLVGLWVGSAGLGVYAVGVLFAEAIWLIPNAVGTVLLSHTSRSDVEESDARLRVVFPATMAVVAAGCLVVAVVAPAIVHLYLGPSYAQVPTITWLLLPGAASVSASKILANELAARGSPGVNTVVSAIGAITTIGADFALIPSLGITGAAIASSAGYSVMAVAMIVAFHHRTRARLF